MVSRVETGGSEKGPAESNIVPRELVGMSVAKVVELVGSSNRSFQDAVDTAIQRASKTVRGIRGVDVVGQKAVVKSGKVTEYRVNLKVSFAVE